jgi:hypothetical protein
MASFPNDGVACRRVEHAFRKVEHAFRKVGAALSRQRAKLPISSAPLRPRDRSVDHEAPTSYSKPNRPFCKRQVVPQAIVAASTHRRIPADRAPFPDGAPAVDPRVAAHRVTLVCMLH